MSAKVQDLASSLFRKLLKNMVGIGVNSEIEGNDIFGTFTVAGMKE
jgi:hypothetical protein